MLDSYWFRARYVLDSYWIRTGSVLDMYWIRTGSVLDMYWIRARSVLDMLIDVKCLLARHWVQGSSARHAPMSHFQA